MKILIVSNLFFPDHEGGAEKVARRSAEILSKTHEVTVLTLGAHEKIKRTRDGYSVVRVPYANFYPYSVGQKTVSAIKKLAWHAKNAVSGVCKKDLNTVLDESAPDVVYMHNAMAFLPQLADLCAARGIPLCAHLHDYNMLCPKTSMYRGSRNCQNPCLQCSLLSAPARKSLDVVTDVIAVSDFVLRRSKAHGLCRNSRWHVLHNAEEEQALVALVDKEPADQGGIVVGYIGALTPNKGLDDLIDAYLSLPDESIRLRIAGSGNDEYVDGLKEKTVARNVTWLGHVDPDGFYEDIDCLVVPSRWHEPQGLTVVEAINRGIPLIASRRGGITEMVEKYGAGVLYEPDSGQLDSALSSMSRFNRIEWRRFVAERYPDLCVPNQLTFLKTRYFDRLEEILIECKTKNEQ